MKLTKSSPQLLLTLAIGLIALSTLSIARADDKGGSSGGGTGNLTQPGITVTFQSNCSSDPCAPDSLSPYRTIFNSGKSLDLSTLGQRRTMYVNAVEAPAIGSMLKKDPAWFTVSESVIYFDTRDLVPKGDTNYVLENVSYASLQACIASGMHLDWCVSRDQLINITTWAPSLMLEDGEYRTYTGNFRNTYRTSGEYIIVKIDFCTGNTWNEAGYFFVKPSRDLITDFQ